MTPRRLWRERAASVKRDEFGKSPADWVEERREYRKYQRLQRWRALKACWLKPVTYRDVRGHLRTQDGRGDDWTTMRAVKLTAALVINRQWTDKAAKKHGYASSLDMAFWDALPAYGGYDVMAARLYPELRFSIFSDGE